MAAVNTAVTVETGSAALGQNYVLYQRTINFATTNLTHTDWFNLFQMPTGAIVMTGLGVVTTAGTASATYDVGVGAGATLLSATALDSEASTAFTMAAPILFDATIISVSINTAPAVLGILRITAVVAHCDAM